MNFKTNKYQIVILWIGIIAFAWLCFSPPTKSSGKTAVDVPRLTSYSLAIIAITGGLIFTQPKLGSLYIFGPPLVCLISMGFYVLWGGKLNKYELSFGILASYLLFGYLLIIIKKVIPRWLSIGFGLLVVLGVGTSVAEDNLQKNIKTTIRTELIEKDSKAIANQIQNTNQLTLADVVRERLEQADKNNRFADITRTVDRSEAREQDIRSGAMLLEFSQKDGESHYFFSTDKAVQITFDERYGRQILPGLTNYFKKDTQNH